MTHAIIYFSHLLLPHDGHAVADFSGYVYLIHLQMAACAFKILHPASLQVCLVSMRKAHAMPSPSRHRAAYMRPLIVSSTSSNHQHHKTLSSTTQSQRQQRQEATPAQPIMAFPVGDAWERGRSRHRQSVDNHYFYPRPQLDQHYQAPDAYQQTAFSIEQDRLYAEQLSYAFYDNEAQIARDHQLAVQLARQRSASPARDLDLERAIELSRRQRTPSPRRDELSARAQPGLTQGSGPPLRREENEVAREQSPGLFVSEDEASAPEDNTPARNCVICGDNTTRATSVLVSCEHRMCRTCLGELFAHSMRDEELFPPRCCRTHEIDVEAARALLGNEFPVGFDARRAEMQTVDRTYCHVQQCSTFIPPENITGDVAICGTCNNWTCTLCKQAGHRRGECPEVRRSAFPQWPYLELLLTH